MFASNVDNTGSQFNITSIVEGDDWDQRQSDRIQVLKFAFFLTLAGSDSSNAIRIMFVRSKVGPLVAANFPTLLNPPDYDKMQVYYDRTYQTSQNGPDIVNDVIYSHNFKSRKVPYLNVNYDDDVSATNAQKNPLYMWIITDSGVSPNPYVS